MRSLTEKKKKKNEEEGGKEGKRKAEQKREKKNGKQKRPNKISFTNLQMSLLNVSQPPMIVSTEDQNNQHFVSILLCLIKMPNKHPTNSNRDKNPHTMHSFIHQK